MTANIHHFRCSQTYWVQLSFNSITAKVVHNQMDKQLFKISVNSLTTAWKWCMLARWLLQD